MKKYLALLTAVVLAVTSFLGCESGIAESGDQPEKSPIGIYSMSGEMLFEIRTPAMEVLDTLSLTLDDLLPTIIFDTEELPAPVEPVPPEVPEEPDADSASEYDKSLYEFELMYYDDRKNKYEDALAAYNEDVATISDIQSSMTVTIEMLQMMIQDWDYSSLHINALEVSFIGDFPQDVLKQAIVDAGIDVNFDDDDIGNLSIFNEQIFFSDVIGVQFDSITARNDAIQSAFDRYCQICRLVLDAYYKSAIVNRMEVSGFGYAMYDGTYVGMSATNEYVGAEDAPSPIPNDYISYHFAGEENNLYLLNEQYFDNLSDKEIQDMGPVYWVLVTIGPDSYVTEMQISQDYRTTDFFRR